MDEFILTKQHSANCPFGKMSFRQKVRSLNCPFGILSILQTVRRQNVRSAKCLFGKMSFGKMSFGKMSGYPTPNENIVNHGVTFVRSFVRPFVRSFVGSFVSTTNHYTMNHAVQFSESLWQSLQQELFKFFSLHAFSVTEFATFNSASSSFRNKIRVINFPSTLVVRFTRKVGHAIQSYSNCNATDPQPPNFASACMIAL